jgi:hypothetical protein
MPGSNIRATMVNVSLCRRKNCGTRLRRRSTKSRRGGTPMSTEKEKRAACEDKRPKSREETPYEGSDSASATARRICDCASANSRVHAARTAREMPLFSVARTARREPAWSGTLGVSRVAVPRTGSAAVMMGVAMVPAPAGGKARACGGERQQRDQHRGCAQ